MPLQDWQIRGKKWLVETAIRCKWFKSSSYTAGELNQLLFRDLPQAINLPMPKGQAELLLLQGRLAMPKAQSQLHLHFLTSFTVDVLGNRIYQAHLKIDISTTPYYSGQDKTLYMRDIKLDKIELISDEYALIKDTSSLIGTLMPNPVKGIISATLGTTLDLLSDTLLGDLRQYLSLYIAGNKQKIIDYHKPDMEQALMDYARDGKLEHKMNEDDFEEGLFARWGKQVRVENGELNFIFHPDL